MADGNHANMNEEGNGPAVVARRRQRIIANREAHGGRIVNHERDGGRREEEARPEPERGRRTRRNMNARNRRNRRREETPVRGAGEPPRDPDPLYGAALHVDVLNLSNDQEASPRRWGFRWPSLLGTNVGCAYRRTLILALAMALPYCREGDFFPTFWIWLFGFFWLYGFPETPNTNMVLVLLAVMGMNEPQLRRLKMFTHVLNVVLMDTSVFLVGLLLSPIVSILVEEFKRFEKSM